MYVHFLFLRGGEILVCFCMCETLPDMLMRANVAKFKGIDQREKRRADNVIIR
jgi:hypothetical protein